MGWISWFKQLDNNNHLLLSLGISLPTGSIDETGDTQPVNPIFDVGGFANNSIQKVEVFVNDY